VTTKVVVLGGCGFIGRNLVTHLLDVGKYSITIVDNLSVGAPFVSDAKMIVGDIRTITQLDADVVINCAAQCGVQQSMQDPKKDMETNVGGIVNLLQLSVKHTVKRFIQLSSFAVLTNRSFYGLSKQVGELYCQMFSKIFGIETVVLRLSNVYGPYSEHKSSVIAKWVRQRKQGQPISVWGDGTQTRDFVFVGDVVETIEKAIATPLPKKHMVLPVCTGVDTMVQTVADSISNKQVVTNELPVGDGNCVVVDPLVTRELLGVGLHSLVCEKVMELI